MKSYLVVVFLVIGVFFIFTDNSSLNLAKKTL